MGTTYSIVEAQRPLVGGSGGHDLLVLEENGVVIDQINGLATGSDHNIKPIGYLPTDTLNVYDTNENTAANGDSNNGGNPINMYLVSEPQVTLFSGSETQIMAQWNAALACASAVNAEDLSYPFAGLGSNSNSVASTLDACMGVYEPSISGSAPITPGVGTLLLTPSQIQTIEQEYGVTNLSLTGDNYVSSDSPSTSASPSVTVTNGSGGTQVTTFSTSGSSGTADLIDYSSGGTQQYQQINLIASNGALSSTISGTGDIIDLDGASLVLAASAQAAVDGANNAVSLAASAALTLAGSGNTVTGPANPTASTGITVTVAANLENLDYSYTTTVVQANSTGSTLTGSNNSLSAGNNASLSIVSGSSTNTTTVSGTGTSVTDNGSGDNVVMQAASDTATAGGTGSNLSLLGNSDMGTLSGANTTASVQGTGDTITATGNAASFDLRGSSNTGNLDGTSETGYDNGAGNLFNATNASIIFGTNNLVGTVEGSGNAITLNTTGETFEDTGTHDTATGSGSGNNYILYGTYDTANANGAGSNISILANNDTGQLNGASTTASVQGTGDTITATGNAASFDLRGSSNTGNLDGTSETGYDNGAGNLFNATNASIIFGTNNLVGTVEGSGNAITLNTTGETFEDTGTHDTATGSGSDNNYILYGTYDTANANGAGSNISLLANNDTASLNAANTTASVQGASDTITATGNAASFDLRGSGNTGTLSGASETGYVNGTSDGLTVGTGDTGVMGNTDAGSFMKATDVTSGETVVTEISEGSNGSTLTFTDNASGSGSGDYTLSGSTQLTGVQSSLLVNNGTSAFDDANLTSGGSQLGFFNATGAIAADFENFTGANGGGTNTSNLLDYTNDTSQYQQMTGLPSGTIEDLAGYSGLNEGGSEQYTIADYSSDYSLVELLAPSSGVNNAYQDFTGLNGTGTMTSANIYNANNTSMTVTYDYNGNSGTDYDTFYQGSTDLGYGIYASNGAFAGSYNGLANCSFSDDDDVAEDDEDFDPYDGEDDGGGGGDYDDSTGGGGGRFGVGNTISSSNTVITLTDGERATFTGSGNTISAASNDDLTMNDSGPNTVILAGDNTSLTDIGTGDSYSVTGQGNYLNVSNASIEVGDNVSAEIEGNTSTLTIGNSDNVSLDAGSYMMNVTLSGSGSTLTENGFGDTILVNASSNTIDLSGDGSGGEAIAGDIVTFSGTDEQIVFSGIETVTAQAGTETTVIGSDGTLTANNNASGGVIQNVIDWNGGGSKVQTFTQSAGALTEDDIGYSGSDGSGDSLYEQVTVTDSSGDTTSSVSGQGALSSLSNASISLADAAMATLNGSGNTITLGNSSGLTIGFGSLLNAINLAGDNAGLNDAGAEDTVTLSGASDTAVLSGDNMNNSNATISGSNALLEFAGSSNGTITFLNNGSGTLKLDMPTGFSGTVAGMGENDTIDLAGFLFSGSPTISGVTGSGTAGTATDITVTEGAQDVMLALLNQYTNQFGSSASAYTLTADSSASSAGTLLQLAASH